MPLGGSCSPSSISPSLGQNSSNNITYNAINIKNFLKERPEKYVLVENQKVNHVKPSQCWNRFSLPAVKDENNRNIIIKNFAICRSCYTTYAYTQRSAKSLNSHKCYKESLSPSSTDMILIRSATVHLKTNT